MRDKFPQVVGKKRSPSSAKARLFAKEMRKFSRKDGVHELISAYLMLVYKERAIDNKKKCSAYKLKYSFGVYNSAPQGTLYHGV